MSAETYFILRIKATRGVSVEDALRQRSLQDAIKAANELYDSIKQGQQAGLEPSGVALLVVAHTGVDSLLEQGGVTPALRHHIVHQCGVY